MHSLAALGFALALAIGCAALVIPGCRSAPACPAELPIDARQALAARDRRHGRWQSLKAEARVTQWADRGRIRGTVLMFLEQPNKVRFDVMSPLGPVAVLTSDGESFQLSDQREETYVYGPTCPANIARLLGISVDATTILRILTGDTPTIHAAGQSLECRDGLYVVVLAGADDATQEVAFSVFEGDLDESPSDQRLVLRRSIARDATGEVRWTATYDDYIDVEGEPFPTNIRFIDSVNQADTSVRVKEITLDPVVPDDAFKQAPAAGMSIEFADCP